MPAFRYALPLFIVFGGGSMGQGGKFMLLGWLSGATRARYFLLWERGRPALSHVHEADQSAHDREWRCEP